MSAKMVTVDVREDIRDGREPFTKIMQAVAGMQAGDALRLLAPFEPAPLYGVLGRQGFSHSARPTQTGDWEVVFQRTTAAEPPASAATEPSQSPNGGQATIELDARGLEPPQPLVKILEALGEVPPGAILRAHTDRRPMHLYSQLQTRGFAGESEEQSDGSFITHIRHV